MVKIRQGTTRQHTDVIQASIRILEQSEDLTDRYLVERARLVQIGHETTATLIKSYLSPVGLDSALRQNILESFQTRMKIWVRDCPLDVMDGKKRIRGSLEKFLIY